MKALATAIFAAGLVISPAQNPPAPQQKPPDPKAARVHGEGCVAPGAETRCVLVRNPKTGVVFNLLIKGMQPEIGSGIEFTGVPHHSITTCMQGTAIDVESWSRKDGLKCTQPTAPQKWH
jgi:hypothetical protein